MCVASEANTWSHRRRASHGFGSWFTNDSKEGRTSWFCRAQRQPCCSSLFFYCIIFVVSSPGGRRKWLCFRRADKQAFFHGSRTLTHPPQTGAADWARSLAVCGCFSPISRPSPAAPTVGGRTPTTKRTPRRCLPAGGLAGDDSGPALVLFGSIALTLTCAGLGGGREAPRRLLSPPAVRPHSPDRLDGNQCRLHGHLTSVGEARCVQQRHIR